VLFAVRPNVRLGTFAGIPLAAHWSALAMPALVAYGLGAVVFPRTVEGAGQAAYWIAAVLVALTFLASLVAHELAHAVVARHQGIPVQGSRYGCSAG
jgi:Zn-dependent protease